MVKIIDKISVICGIVGSYATGFLLFFIIVNVLLRFVLSKSFNWMTEMEWHFFGLIFLLGGSYNILKDKHVRVDFFYDGFPEKWKTFMNLTLHIIFLIPWAMVGIYTCFIYASNSFYIREESSNPGGLSAMYPIKYCIVLCFGLIFIQAFSEIIKEGQTLYQKWNT